MANKDLVVKLTINSNDFDNGLKNAKASMNKFNADTKGMSVSFKNVIGGMTKAFSALGVAMAAKNIFKDVMNSTEEAKDNWDNTMGAMKDSWNAFLFQVNNGNFQGLKDIINYAKQARLALDSLGDATALFNLDLGENQAKMTELLSSIQKKKKSGQDYSADVEAYNQLLEGMRNDAAISNKISYDALTALFGKHGVILGDYGLTPREAARQARLSATGQYADVEALKKAMNTKPDLDDVSDFDITLAENPVEKLRNEWGKERFNRAMLLRTLGNITTEEKEAMEKILTETSARDRTIAQMEKQLNRYLNAEDLTTTPTTISSTTLATPAALPQLDLIPALTPISAGSDDTTERMEKLRKKLEEMNTVSEETVLINTMMNMVWQNQIDNLNTYGNAIGYLGQTFANLQDIASDDSAWSKFSGTMGGVISQIVSLISTYTALVGIQAVAESIKAGNGIPFPYNLVLIAAAGAALAGIIATISSQTKSQFGGAYEQGGIVPGNSYTGDRLWVRVNSGEMILNRHQQAQLFGGGNASNVHFVIEGSQLRGVLDNYDKTKNL